MRRLFFSIAAVGVLSGCATLGAKDPQGGAKVSFRAEGGESSGPMLDGVMFRRGEAVRLDLNDPTEGAFTIIADKTSLTMIGVEDGQAFAVKMPADAADELPMKELQNPIAADARDVGACTAAGEAGRLYEQGKDANTMKICVTADKLILRIQEGDRTTWETTAVERGEQAASLFQIPAGVETIDLSTFGRDVKRP